MTDGDTPRSRAQSIPSSVNPDAAPVEQLADQESDNSSPWSGLLAECIYREVATLREIADEIGEPYAETLRQIADDYELIADLSDR